MANNDFADWERVFCATIDNSVVSFALFCEKDGMPEEYDCQPFIGFIFVDENYRGKRISQYIISHIKNYAKNIGFQTVYLKTDHRGLYEKYGFEKIGEFVPVSGTSDQLFKIDL